MTAAELAERMGVSQSAVTRMEQSERTGHIQFDTLQRAADALECEVVYALVPRRDLDDVVTERARELAAHRLRRVGHTMAMEEQLVDDATMAAKLDVLTEQYRGTPGLWRPDRTERRSRTPVETATGCRDRWTGVTTPPTRHPSLKSSVQG